MRASFTASGRFNGLSKVMTLHFTYRLIGKTYWHEVNSIQRRRQTEARKLAFGTWFLIGVRRGAMPGGQDEVRFHRYTSTNLDCRTILASSSDQCPEPAKTTSITRTSLTKGFQHCIYINATQVDPLHHPQSRQTYRQTTGLPALLSPFNQRTSTTCAEWGFEPSMPTQFAVTT